MIEVYAKIGNPLLKVFLDMNGIKECFVWKNGERNYAVYAGKSPSGFHEKDFSRLKDAKTFCAEMNKAIQESQL